MKKIKVPCMAFIAMMGILISGCKAGLNELEEESKKLEELVNDG